VTNIKKIKELLQLKKYLKMNKYRPPGVYITEPPKEFRINNIRRKIKINNVFNLMEYVSFDIECF